MEWNKMKYSERAFLHINTKMNKPTKFIFLRYPNLSGIAEIDTNKLLAGVFKPFEGRPLSYVPAMVKALVGASGADDLVIGL